MPEMTDAELDAAEERGRIAAKTEPRAKSASYDRTSGQVVVSLTNGCIFSFPARIAQGLESATDEQLAEVEVSPSGIGLHWDALDEDYTVAGLMAGRFGTARFMRERFGPRWDAVAAE